MDQNQNLFFLVKINNELFKLLETKDFIEELKQTCDIYKQKHEGLSNDALLPLCVKIKINFQEICKNKGNLNTISLKFILNSINFTVLKSLITKETKSFSRITEELIKNLANRFLKNSEIYISKNKQVHLDLQITDLPLQDYKFSLRDTNIKRTLSSFRCIIFKTSPAAKYM